MNNQGMPWVDARMFVSEAFRTYRVLLPGIDLDNWDAPAVKAANRDLMRRKSSMHHEIAGNRGGWVFPEKVYVNDPTYVSRAPEHSEELDRFIMQQPMCRSLAVRFEFISRTLLPRYVAEALSGKNAVRIGSFGSGTGRDVMEGMRLVGRNVTADLYDLDERAFVEGKVIADNLGLRDRVRFICGDLTKVLAETYDIGLLIGIICPLRDPVARRTIRQVARNVSPTGVLIVSSSSEKMATGDVLSRFLIEYSADWFLQFRDRARMDALVASAGLSIVESTAEPSGFNRVVVAAPNSTPH